MEPPKAERKIRVALVIGQLHAGGSERQVYELATRLVGGPCIPFVYCLSQVVKPFGPRLERAGVALRVIPRRRSYEWARLRLLSRSLAEDRIDLVHALGPSPNLYAWLARGFSRRPVFLTSNRAVDDTPGRITTAINSLVFRRSRCVVVNSNAGREFTRTHYGVPDERIVMIPNGVDLRRFGDLPDPAAVRKSLDLPAGAPVAGIVGRISWEKEVGVFLQAAGIVAARIPEARFLVVGDGPDLPEMRRRASGAGLDDRVRFTGDRDDVPALLGALDLLALTSSQEGMPNSVLEAMAAGRPVVATAVGGCRELVTEGITGHLVPPGDVEALAGQMADLLARPDRGRPLGEAGRRRVEREYGAAAMADRFVDLYRRLSEEAQPRRLAVGATSRLANSGFTLNRLGYLRLLARFPVAARRLRLRVSPEILSVLNGLPPSEESSRLYAFALTGMRIGRVVKSAGVNRNVLTDACLIRLARRDGLVRIADIGVSDGSASLGLFSALPEARIRLFDNYPFFRIRAARFGAEILGARGERLYRRTGPLLRYIHDGRPGRAPEEGETRIPVRNPLLKRFAAEIENLDLFEDDLPEAQQIIKCCNCLNLEFYPPERLVAGIERLLGRLEDGGYLLVGQNNAGYREGEAYFALKRIGAGSALVEERNDHRLLAWLRRHRPAILDGPPGARGS